ncbi:MAG: methionyl-tRNA formyltransferase [Lachnospiraceae bacterium]|nr:methionyl-tRNA formyltransferase [Lachnospiraceae bacterium]
MRIVFMGTPDFAVSSLKALYEAGYEIAAVVTQPDKPKGRKKELTPPPVKEYALSVSLPVLQPEKLKNGEWDDKLSALGADLFVVAAFGQILPQNILDMPKYGCINLHASLLPEYRGAAPIQQAILDGKKETGVTIQQMTLALDSGDIISRKVVPIDDEDTGGSLFDKLAEEGARLLLETIPRIESGDIDPEPQDESVSSYVKMLKKEDGRLDFSLPAAVLHNRVRGLSPWPGAFTEIGGKKLRIWKTQVLDKDEDHEEAGKVLAAGKAGIDIACGQGVLRILELQPEGKKNMKAADYLLGHAILIGTKFGQFE